MNSNKHVYCTNCFNFKIDTECLPYCNYEDKCNFDNFEDSKPFKDRPYYIEFKKEDDINE